MSQESTSATVAALAARGVQNPFALSPAELRRVCASALTQAADVPSPQAGEVEAALSALETDLSFGRYTGDERWVLVRLAALSPVLAALRSPALVRQVGG